MEEIIYVRLFFANEQYDWFDSFTLIDFSLWVTERYKKDGNGYVKVIRRWDKNKDNHFVEWDRFEAKVEEDQVGEYITIPHAVFDNASSGDRVYAGKKRTYIGDIFNEEPEEQL